MNPRGGRHFRPEAPNSRWSRHSTWLLALGAVVLVAAGVIAGFSLGPRSTPVRQPAPAPPLRATPNSSVPSLTPTRLIAPLAPGDFTTAFAQLQSGLHAEAGLALRAVGAGSTKTITLGTSSFGDQPAWSTIKVPLVIAAMHEQHTDQVTQPMTAAITESDNAAAESIWESLGDPTTAASKVEAVLRDTGDPTIVESQKVRPEYTAFGQTKWSLTNQALFLSAAACDSGDQPVLELMGQVENDQRWGLGSLPGAEIKGGWGPSPAGRYLVRQIGILPTPNGLSVVAMAAEPESGSFADGTQALTDLARWLQARLNTLPAGRCNS